MTSIKNQSEQIICLRPETDFIEFDAIAPSRFDVTYLKPDDPDLLIRAEKAKAMIIPAVGPKIQNEIFEKTAIKMVQVTGAGIDRIDTQFCERNQIAVCNVQGGSAFAVAEYCLGSVITLSRQLHLGNKGVQMGEYSAIRQTMLNKRMVSLQNQHVGIIGFGSIGRETARLFHLMGCQISCFDMFPPDIKEADKIKANICDLPTLLEQCDIISLHVPLTDQTKNLISEAEINMMKPTSLLVNAARGGVVDESALASALEDGRINGAVIDVYSDEPAASNNPLLNLSAAAQERVFYSPHIAGITKQSWTDLFQKSWANLERYFDKNLLNYKQV